ncbi:glutaredoxin [Legionella birminghamensis]|uniref:Glutaredoxin n=1 Tax=Legionella birminghamensis TaxID=28083 RepID=A0A378IBL4_9GAMM|nr:glutaredoxin 3 [Legionella birminghamensis]KTC74323.1 glutaredoxin [Legionella birminghamensis]STX32559.1 grxC glutaredoxin 3 [Legionella birminghamensis]
MANIVIYSTGYCPYCVRAKQLLDSKKVNYQEIRVDEEPAKRDEMIARSGRRTVPQIFIDGQHIGGCDDLYTLEDAGKLDQLLQ